MAALDGLDVLRIVGLAPGLTTAEISERVHLVRSSAERWLLRSEDSGLVYRTYRQDALRRRPTARWYYNTKPFDRASDKPPENLTRAERRKALK